MSQEVSPLRGKIDQIGYIPAFRIEDVESAVKFYKKYGWNSDLLFEEHPVIYRMWLDNRMEGIDTTTLENGFLITALEMWYRYEYEAKKGYIVN